MKVSIPDKIKAYTKDDYKKLIGEAIEKVFKKECLIIFFGSINTDRFSRVSDIDVAIYSKEPVGSCEIVKITEEIEKLPILREVDIVDVRKIKDYRFLEKIVNEGTVWKNMPELMKDLKRLLKSLKK